MQKNSLSTFRALLFIGIIGACSSVGESARGMQNEVSGDTTSSNIARRVASEDAANRVPLGIPDEDQVVKDTCAVVNAIVDIGEDTLNVTRSSNPTPEERKFENDMREFIKVVRFSTAITEAGLTRLFFPLVRIVEQRNR